MRSNIHFFSTIATWLILLTSPFLSLSALALGSDRQQPINIQADQAEFNPNTGIATYTGTVVLTQGSLKVAAHQLTIYQTDSGELDKVVAQGKEQRVHIQQQPNEQDPLVHAYAMHVEYFALEQEILLTDSAEVENGSDRFTGENIRYSLQNRNIRAWGKKSNVENNPDADEGRVKIILFPQNSKKQEQSQ
ncbi:lipopolysaccharide transport periplasmic protein LptA [Oceanospirillum beijerinckii]|uniref:lipopolysaccharide transport periplasmic protein LptA n=1 Tax=Oceanospirillum beijerinckii TaxID=64976 RepID=UPI000429198C|nr:lipopolysaccharide transport periplasmic protein LptA [Oceanospirillum beijerinckii]MAC45637.1 lipopolysaccharide transport periplasmic protein LptA [Oceanospirillum sp.]